METQATTTKPAIGLKALSIYILYRLYVDYVNDRSDNIDLDYICASYLTTPSRNLTKSAIDRFRGYKYSKTNLISRSGSSATGYSYGITQQGIEAVEEALRTENSLMRHLARDGEAALLSHYTVDVAGQQDAEDFEESELLAPSDWEAIDVDQNAADISDAIDAVEKLVIEIRISNVFSAEYPGQSQSVIDTLEGGVEKLKEGRPSRMQIFLMLQKPIAWLSEKFIGTALGELAKRAAIAIAKLLGI